MEAVKFEGMNTTYVAPGCFDLPTMAEEKDGRLEVTSCWKPSAEGLEVHVLEPDYLSSGDSFIHLVSSYVVPNSFM